MERYIERKNYDRAQSCWSSHYYSGQSSTNIESTKLDETVIIGVVSALIGIIGTYLVAILKHRKDLEFKYDTDRREKRITQYSELWKLLQDLAKYAQPKELNYGDVGTLSGSLRQWYFEKGGLFLSD